MVICSCATLASGRQGQFLIMKPGVLGSGPACGPGMVAAYSQRQLAVRGAPACPFTNAPQRKSPLSDSPLGQVFVCGIQIKLHPECKLAPGKGHLYWCGIDCRLYLDSDPSKMIKCFPWTKRCARHFTGHISFNPHNCFM